MNDHVSQGYNKIRRSESKEITQPSYNVTFEVKHCMKNLNLHLVNIQRKFHYNLFKLKSRIYGVRDSRNHKIAQFFYEI